MLNLGRQTRDENYIRLEHFANNHREPYRRATVADIENGKQLYDAGASFPQDEHGNYENISWFPRRIPKTDYERSVLKREIEESILFVRTKPLPTLEEQMAAQIKADEEFDQLPSLEKSKRLGSHILVKREEFVALILKVEELEKLVKKR